MKNKQTKSLVMAIQMKRNEKAYKEREEKSQIGSLTAPADALPILYICTNHILNEEEAKKAKDTRI
jgi:hypothetical protein